MKAKPKPITLLYADSPTIGLAELEKIIQAVSLYADQVWLHGGLSISPRLPEGDQGFIRGQLNALVEQDLVRMWDFEERRVGGGHNLLTRAISGAKLEYVDSGSYNDIREGVHMRVTDYSRKIRDRSAQVEKGRTEPVEGLAELVHLRNNLWSVLLSRHLSTDGLLVYQGRWESLRSEFKFFYADTEYAQNIQIWLDEISSWRGLAGFAFIKLDELAEIRNLFPEFRQFALDGIGPFGLKLSDEGQLRKQLDELRTKFTRELETELRRRIPSWWQLVTKQLGGAAVSILSLFLPPLSAVGNASDLLGWMRDRNRGRHLLYLIELERRLQQAASLRERGARS